MPTDYTLWLKMPRKFNQAHRELAEQRQNALQSTKAWAQSAVLGPPGRISLRAGYVPGKWPLVWQFGYPRRTGGVRVCPRHSQGAYKAKITITARQEPPQLQHGGGISPRATGPRPGTYRVVGRWCGSWGVLGTLMVFWYVWGTPRGRVKHKNTTTACQEPPQPWNGLGVGLRTKSKYLSLFPD